MTHFTHDRTENKELADLCQTTQILTNPDMKQNKPTPICPKCFREKTLRRNNRWRCLPCERQWKREHRKDTREKDRLYRLTHKEELSAYLRQYNRTVRKQNKESDGKRFMYKDQAIRMTVRRTGICNLCRAVAPIDCKYTNFHHVWYNDANPEEGMIELCRRCHNWESLEMNQIKRDSVTGRFI